MAKKQTKADIRRVIFINELDCRLNDLREAMIKEFDRVADLAQRDFKEGSD